MPDTHEEYGSRTVHKSKQVAELIPLCVAWKGAVQTVGLFLAEAGHSALQDFFWTSKVHFVSRHPDVLSDEILQAWLSACREGRISRRMFLGIDCAFEMSMKALQSHVERLDDRVWYGAGAITAASENGARSCRRTVEYT